MVYEVKGDQNQQTRVLSLKDRCIDMIYHSRCIKTVNEQFVKPIMEFSAKEGITMDTDPLEVAWRLLRQGGMMCALVNQFQGGTIKEVHPLDMDEEDNYVVTDADAFTNDLARENVYHFIESCQSTLMSKKEELFAYEDLFTDNTNVLTKALALVDKCFKKIGRVQRVPFAKLIDKMKAEEAAVKEAEAAERRKSNGGSSGEASSTEATANDKRLKVIEEILNTELGYVSDLEKLATYRDELRVDNIVDEEVIKTIFSNLDELIDFQRRYSMLVETTLGDVLGNLEASYDAHIGKKLFIDREASFAVYNTYVSNNANSREAVLNNMDALMAKARIMDPQGTLNSYLIKPIQRICKYPLLLRELIKNSAPDAKDKAELEAAYAVADRITLRINELMTMGENDMEAEKMKMLVTDWSINRTKIDKEALGHLLRYEKANQMGKDGVGNEVTLYLFESVLLVCRAGKASIMSSRPGLSLKACFKVNLISYIEDISNATDLFYGIRFHLRTSGDTGPQSVSFKVKNAESVKLWIKSMDKVGIEKGEAAKVEEPPAPAPEANKRSSFLPMRRRAPVAAAAVAIPVVASAASSGGESTGKTVAFAPLPPKSTPQLAAVPEAAAQRPESLQLKLVFQGEAYIRVIPGLPSMEQIKKFAVKTFTADWDRFGLPFTLTKDDMILKYMDDAKDLINVTEDGDLCLAHLLDPGRLTIHVFDKHKVEKGAKF